MKSEDINTPGIYSLETTPLIERGEVKAQGITIVAQYNNQKNDEDNWRASAYLSIISHLGPRADMSDKLNTLKNTIKSYMDNYPVSHYARSSRIKIPIQGPNLLIWQKYDTELGNIETSFSAISKQLYYKKIKHSYNPWIISGLLAATVGFTGFGYWCWYRRK